MKPTSAALTGALLTMPLLAANAIVANRVEPLFSWIRPGPHTSRFEYLLLFVVLACLPLGAFIAARPMFAGRDGRRQFHVLNAFVAIVMLGVFAVVAVALGGDIYRCDIQQIANCD